MLRQVAQSLTLVDATAMSFSPESPRTLPMLGTQTCRSHIPMRRLASYGSINFFHSKGCPSMSLPMLGNHPLRMQSCHGVCLHVMTFSAQLAEHASGPLPMLGIIPTSTSPKDSNLRPSSAHANPRVTAPPCPGL